MNKFLFSLLIRVLSLGCLLLLQQGSLTAQVDPTCNNNNMQGCTWTAWQIQPPSTIIVTVPGYPSCEFKVEWQSRVCFIAGPPEEFRYEVLVTGMQYGVGAGCDWYIAHINDLEQQGRIDSSFNLISRMYMEATRIQMNAIASSIIYNTNNTPIERFDCIPPVLQCNSAVSQIEVTANMSRCAEFFVLKKNLADGNEVRWTDWRWCADQGCCRITRRYCRDPNTGQLRSCETVTTIPGMNPCEGNAIYTPPPGATIHSRTGCRIRRCDF